MIVVLFTNSRKRTKIEVLYNDHSVASGYVDSDNPRLVESRLIKKIQHILESQSLPE